MKKKTLAIAAGVAIMLAAVIGGVTAGVVRQQESASSASERKQGPTGLAKPTASPTPTTTPTPPPATEPLVEPAPDAAEEEAPSEDFVEFVPPVAAPLPNEPRVVSRTWPAGDYLRCRDAFSHYPGTVVFAWEAEDTEAVDIYTTTTTSDFHPMDGWVLAASNLSPYGSTTLTFDCGVDGLPPYIAVRVVARNSMHSATADWWGLGTLIESSNESR